jgi:hypothetical protein
MNIPMSESILPPFEKKLILPPQAIVKLLFAVRGGTFVESQGYDLQSLLKEVEFPTGPDSKAAKLESAEQGNVIVSRSIVTMMGDIGDQCRVLLLHREQEHSVTKGASILTSGDPRKSSAEVLANKVTIEPTPVDFRQMGLALSSPEQTGGVHYLFDVVLARIAQDATVQTLKDHGTLLSPEEILEAIKDKPLELAIFRKIFNLAS